MAHSSFREQFGDLARKKGVQESLIPFWTNWVMAWGKYLSPRKFVDAGESDVEAFLQHLADQGKAGWQIEQAEAALKLLHQSRYPTPWSADWKVRQPLAAATASPEQRPPLAVCASLRRAGPIVSPQFSASHHWSATRL